ncbi:TetR/AcrR family transcriptional regulator [Arthrobacter sp. SDTb3-6]|uniref:TetR/AcrR family transcriptional regulator n=1 Tax=Arthrobacter sp. SDTb3-6 TaxID=2713571 RepID=UPI00159E2D5E|nr:TetR/AcrR family transcriptional regulator [Arthrobacter sp. SDTb3-6]NVM99461.1 TetR/AcrR family transcriptional regulator [Arthrobacter sp. SDTb3-6]
MLVPPSRGRYAKGVERREQIIQTATDVFATEGFEGTALRRVAELVGVRESTLFHYFGTKQELLTAVLEERDRRAHRDLGGEGGDMVSALPAVARRNAAQPGLTTLYAVASATASAPDHASHEYFHNRFKAVVDNAARDIAARQEAGTLRTDLPAVVLARLLVAASDGLQLQWMYDKTLDMARDLDSLATTLFAPPAVPNNQ